ncbi:asparagine synthase-related protein [Streptomyces sp. NPDC057654]|uniref:asparagine synthase-related protein n=1 Tax=Streptomyces sp. NPDC057654 TaxID=3346196 RepID=UPI0036832CFA
MRIWSVGYEADEIRTSTDQAPAPVAAVLALGCCLATGRELDDARDAVARGGWSAATRLPGSYLTVARTGATMRIAGDRAGVVTVYWCMEGERVVWATAAAALAAYGRITPDLAVLLAAFSVRGVDVLAGQSHFEGVRRVRPGWALVLRPGHRPRTEPVPAAAGGLSFAEGARMVRERMTTAVARRAAGAGRLSADLSGGVDSGAVTSLAAGSGPLLAVTYTDARMGEQDDVLYAERIAAGQAHITHAWVHGTRDSVQHFDGLTEPAALPFTDTPSFTLGLLAIKQAQLAPAAAYGSRAHLTGRGGDDVLDAVALMVIDQYRAGHRAEAVRRVMALARAKRCAVHPLLWQAARTQRSRYPQALAALAQLLGGPRDLRHPGWAPPWEMLCWCGVTPSAPWLTRSGRLAVADLVARRAADADPLAAPGAVHERLALEVMGDGHATYDQIARQQWGLPLHAPFLDTPVVDVCHAVPGWYRNRPGDYKPLARAAFTPAVPAFLLNRRTKTAFTGSVYTGLRVNAPALRRILSGSVLAEAGLLDASRTVAALDRAVRGEPAPLACLHALIVTELWLATLPTARDTWWEKTTTGEKEAAR